MNQLQKTTGTALEKKATQVELRAVIAARLNELRTSPQTLSIVMAQTTGTPIREASPAQLASMWNEAIGLFKIEFASNADFNAFQHSLRDLSDWVRREYGSTTCEEVRLAYNQLVKEELRKSSGQVLEAYPKLDPRHFGEVMAAFRRGIETNAEINRIHAQQQLSEPEPEKTEAEIEAFMLDCLSKAVEHVRSGQTYRDPGNSLYHWLFQTRRFLHTEAEIHDYMRRAEPIVAFELNKERTRFDTSVAGVTRRKQAAEVLEAVILGSIPAEYATRVRATAKQIYVNDYLKKLANNELHAAH